jgi:hypothetical protein
MAKRLVFFLTIAVLVTLAGMLVAGNRAGAGARTEPPVLDRVSNQGERLPAPLSPRDEQALGRMPGANGEVKLMGAYEGRAFYRFGPECFGTGPVSGSEYRFGALICTPQFPSKARPLLDMTVFHGTGQPGNSRPTDLFVGRSEGFAADGVASVAFKTTAGEIVGKTPVRDNTYSHSPIPAGPLAALVALDSSDEVIHSVPLHH